MAIINSLAVGKARKSAGNLTYRTVRGRTIASAKVGKRSTGEATRVPGEGLLQNQVMAVISQFMRIHSSDIAVSFNRTRYGSQRNYFMKLNYQAFRSMVISGTIAEGMSDSELDTGVAVYATANPTVIVRVRLTGFTSKYMTGEWTSADNPISGGANVDLAKGKLTTTVGGDTLTAPVASTIQFNAGAKIVRGAGSVSMVISSLPGSITASDVSYLGPNGIAITPAVTVTIVSSVPGKLVMTVPALTEAQNVVGVKIKNLYYRLTSAYINNSEEAPDPM